ncbi:MAG: hypothetical protein Q9160_008000 [Pyrenula sp. 1 TL-2023]
MASGLYHTPLDERSIRLLNVSVDEENANLIMTLESFSLDKPLPAYAAMSYVWAPNASDERPTFGEDRVVVSPSLWEALLCIAWRKLYPRLWVDALCINQADNDEKASQVRIMHQVFASAECVLIWFGSIGDEEAREVDTVLQINQEASTAKSPLSQDQARQHNRAFRPILSKRWFSRAWTWQESYVARSRKFFWGHFTFDEDFMDSFLSNSLRYMDDLRNDASFQDSFFRKVVPMLTGLAPWEDLAGKFDFAKAMKQRRAAGCKCPSDIVYSVMNASPGAPKLPVDYVQPSLTTFAQAAYFNIKQTGSLGILSQAQQHLQTAVSIDAKRMEWSSWVPDWRWPYRDEEISSFSDNVAPGTQAKPSVTSDWRVLTLQGIFLDVLTQDINKQLPNPRSLQQPKQEEIYPPTFEPTSVALASTAKLGKEPYIVKTVDNISPRDRLGMAMMFGIPYKDQSEASKARKSQSRLDQFLKVNKIAMTRQGYYANVPITAQEDDVIAILYGSNLPLVLRPINYTERPGGEDKVKYTLVGQCYVHGFMEGQALRAAAKEEQANAEGIATGPPALTLPTLDFDIV